MALPRSDSRLSIFAALEPRSRMQPPCTPVVSRTSKPCSSGLSQRRANPKPASALPVAIASSNWSVEPPKLISSTSRLRLANRPFSCATGTPTVQMALAFQVSFSGFFCGTTVTGTVAAVRQIGGAPVRLSGTATRLAPKTLGAARANGKAVAAAPSRWRRDRRGMVSTPGSVRRGAARGGDTPAQIQPAGEALDVGQGRPDRPVQLIKAHVGGDEAIADIE